MKEADAGESRKYPHYLKIPFISLISVHHIEMDEIRVSVIFPCVCPKLELLNAVCLNIYMYIYIYIYNCVGSSYRARSRMSKRQNLWEGSQRSGPAKSWGHTGRV